MSWYLILPWGADEWSAFGSSAGALATAGATAAVIYAAKTAFPSWQKQKRHERMMVLAEEVLAVAYKVKRAFPVMRVPFSRNSELAAAERELRENGTITDATLEDTKSALVTAQTIIGRVREQNDVFNAAIDKMPAAKAVFGDVVADQLDALLGQRNEVVGAAHGWAHGRTGRVIRDGRALEDHLARQEKFEMTFWEGAGADGVDHVMVAVNRAIENLERELLPIIRDQPPGKPAL